MRNLTVKTILSSTMKGAWSVIKFTALACISVVMALVLIISGIMKQIFYSTYPR